MPEYITKDQTIELLHYYGDEKCSAIIADVEELESADVAPVVHAQWELYRATETRTGFIDFYLLRCSNCGKFVSGEADYKFCPHCGARMEGEE